MKTLRLSILSFALLMIATVSTQAAELASAKVLSVTGSVAKYTAGGAEFALKVGDILREGDSVRATALSEAKLVFSNGSEVTIEENTSVTIAKLQQDAFSGGQSYEQLQADPSRSQTLLELNYGQLSGHTKQLRSDSQFDISTPLGTAAIRGTKWSVSLIYNAERGEFILSVRNIDGLVDLISRFAGTVQYGAGNVADKGYDSSASETTRELIPQDHTIIIRLHRNDPLFDTLFSIIENYEPTGPKPVIMPGPPPGVGGGADDDFGIIVVSPEGPSS